MASSVCRLPAAPAAPQRAAFRGTAAPGSRPAVPQARRVAARVAPPGAAGSTASGAAEVADLRRDLAVAIQSEDYAAAAQLRDRITELESQDPLLAAQAELEAAVREERFEDAARLRDRVKQLQPPPPPPPPPALEQPGFDPTAVTVSDKVTDGIRVTCRSFFVPSESRPAASPPLFLFGYQITIKNEGPLTIKLMERYWHITNGQGLSQEVRGLGVVGQHPELAPGESFTYQSACPLPTPRGSMQGNYEFYSKDAATGRWNKSFLVEIGKFELRADV